MPDSIREDREVMEVDVLIVGGGPSGLSSAIRLAQLKPDLSIVVLEKGAEIGAHLLSGAAFETRALDELIPDWKEKNAPLNQPITKDTFRFLCSKKAWWMPTPPQMHNKGNYIISLGELSRWLAEQAQALGVEIFPGFPASQILFNDDNQVIGVATGDMGLDEKGEKTDTFEPGMELHAKQTVLAEGCHGHLSKQLISHYNLRENSDPQTYGIGIKEIWEVKPENHKPGFTMHTIGWPMDPRTYGGSWMYHYGENLVSLGFVIGLDYQNPYLSPFEEMQRWKTHPAIAKYLDGARRINYGARALVEGGLQSLPKLTFPGGVLVGDAAGFLNVPKIKGNHTAMKSGMIAAESLIEHLADYGDECASYQQNFENSWIHDELYKVRNIRPGFHGGLWAGLINAAWQTIGGWRMKGTKTNHADHAQLKPAAECIAIEYPKPDGILTFDRLSSVFLTNTNHRENEPCHLVLKDPSIPLEKNLPVYAEPAQRYCPAAVYEIIEEKGQKKFQINSQNCIHCKTCDIKDPAQNINWVTPEGGGGPNYGSM